MSARKILIIIGFFFINGLLIGSLFTGIDYLVEILLFTVVMNVLYLGLLVYIKRSTEHISD
ncbi:hypothetical protein [Halalkalibacter krulwichiae]|uniref:Uncharacterized protein n=1 Tax=Halalkalibacter krulwichiae TaxID=199441 RepID=A0A1X9MAV2_9BACI|nr:hypothetical protein [Halalkalibacter krulwichiae]ARK30579.1 hypothetical protein BkAM31D_12480 [Halalkalibacter krulwichiae]